MTDIGKELGPEIGLAMRVFIANHARKVNFEHDYGWGPTVSPYSWGDFDADDHIRGGCRWVVPEGSLVEEQTYSMFDGTFTGNKDEVGINASGCRCACGQYEDVTLRATSSLGEAIQFLLGHDATRRMQL